MTYMYGHFSEAIDPANLKKALLKAAERAEKEAADEDDEEGSPLGEDEVKDLLAAAAEAKELAALLSTGNSIVTYEPTAQRFPGYINSGFMGLDSQCGVIFFDHFGGYANPTKDIMERHLATCFRVARFLNYSRAVITHNTKWPYVPILLELGWKELDRFDNRRSGNTVVVLGKDIDPA
jgi:hypothetical protein